MRDLRDRQRSQDVGDDEVVGEAGEGFLRVVKARGSRDSRDITARVSIDVVRRVG